MKPAFMDRLCPSYRPKRRCECREDIVIRTLYTLVLFPVLQQRSVHQVTTSDLRLFSGQAHGLNIGRLVENGGHEEVYA